MEKIIYACPLCFSSKVYRHGKNKAGDQAYRCRDCGRVYTWPPKQPLKLDRSGVSCPKCSGTQLYGNGKRQGNQVWICKGCRTSFTSDGGRVPDVKRKIVINLIKEGFDRSSISRACEVSSKFVWSRYKELFSDR
jgi:transposase-like protein